MPSVASPQHTTRLSSALGTAHAWRPPTDTWRKLPVGIVLSSTLPAGSVPQQLMALVSLSKAHATLKPASLLALNEPVAKRMLGGGKTPCPLRPQQIARESGSLASAHVKPTPHAREVAEPGRSKADGGWRICGSLDPQQRGRPLLSAQVWLGLVEIASNEIWGVLGGGGGGGEQGTLPLRRYEVSPEYEL